MDDYEADYLPQQLRDLEQSRRRWRALAFFSLAALVLLVILGGGLAFTVGLGMNQRMQRVMKAEMDARMRAQRAMQAEAQARRQAEEAVRKARTKE
jgi:hypothetical protein